MLEFHISELIAGIVYFCLLITIGITFRSFSSDINDYLRAGCRGTWWLVGVSTFMASFTAMTFVAIAGQSFVAGWSPMLITVGGVFTGVLQALWFAPRFRQLRVTSNGDVMVQRFGRSAEQFVAYYGMISGVFGAALALVGTATFVATVFGVPLWVLIIVVGVVITIYSSCAGAWGVLATDFVQGAILVAITVTVTVLALVEIGGIGEFFRQIEVQGLSGDFALIKPDDHVYRTPVKLTFGLFTWGWLIGLTWLQFCQTTALGARFIQVKDGREARRAAALVAVLMAGGALIWYIPPMVARLLYYDEVMAVRGVPNVADAAYAVVSGKVLPRGLIGIMAVAILAATMSSMDTAFNSISALVVRNIYPPLAARLGLPVTTDPKKLLIFGRCVNACYGVILICLGLSFARYGLQRGLYSYMLIVSALLGFPSMVPLTMAMFVRRTPWWSYFVSMGCGLCGSVFCWLAPTLVEMPGMPAWLAAALARISGPEHQILWHWQLFIIGALGAAGWLASVFFWKRSPAAYREQVEAFYRQMERPVDFRREVGVGNDFRQFKMVGFFVMVAGGLLSLLLLVPNPWSGRLAIVCVASAVLALGGVLYRLGVRSFRRFEQEEPDASAGPDAAETAPGGDFCSK